MQFKKKHKTSSKDPVSGPYYVKRRSRLTKTILLLITILILLSKFLLPSFILLSPKCLEMYLYMMYVNFNQSFFVFLCYWNQVRVGISILPKITQQEQKERTSTYKKYLQLKKNLDKIVPGLRLCSKKY